MKRLMLFQFLLVILTSFTACTKDDDNPGNNPGNQTPSAGKWKISYFFDKQDETSNYTNYTFDFSSNGTLTATSGSQTWQGTWLTGYDDSKNKFLIDFTGTIPSQLQELEEDWLIISMDDQFMHFEHTSGGNGDTDVLKFSKI